MKDTEVIIFPADGNIPIINYFVKIPESYKFQLDSGTSLSAKNIFRIEVDASENKISLFEKVSTQISPQPQIAQESGDSIICLAKQNNSAKYENLVNLEPSGSIVTLYDYDQDLIYVGDNPPAKKINTPEEKSPEKFSNSIAENIKIWVYGKYESMEMVYISFMYLNGSFQE